MNTKILNKGSGIIELVSLNESGEELVLMRISSGLNTKFYKIEDFRYSLFATEPTANFESEISYETLELSCIPEDRRMEELFFPHSVRNGIVYWQTHDGIVIDGADHPFFLQSNNPRNRNHIWSYRAARNKMREAKEFWNAFEGAWGESKITTEEAAPSSRSIRCKYRKEA